MRSLLYIRQYVRTTVPDGGEVEGMWDRLAPKNVQDIIPAKNSRTGRKREELRLTRPVLVLLPRSTVSSSNR